MLGRNIPALSLFCEDYMIEIKPMKLKELLETDFTRPLKFWKRDFENQIVFLESPYRYEVDLKGIGNADIAFSEFRHLTGKSWCTPEMLAELFYLIDDHWHREDSGQVIA